MRKVLVVSKKYDGSLRDEYEAYLYADADDSITFYSPPGVRYWDHRKSAWFEAEDGLLEIYFKHKWYNVWHICEQISNVNLMYVNIAMPTKLHSKRLEWIDLDLDYRANLDHSVQRLDEAEFEKNIQLMRYPPAVVEQARLASQEVEAGLQSKTYPFDHGRQVEIYDRIRSELAAGNGDSQG